MNQVIQMFKESNARMRKIMNSDYDIKQITAAQREFAGQIKLVNSVVNAFGIVSKNKRAMKGLENMNIMDPSTAIEIFPANPDEDKIKCPDLEKIISRQECLDYSGLEQHMENCSSCDHFKTTRDLLID